MWGSDRSPAFGQDFQQPFFEDWLRWAGVGDIVSIRFQPNLAVADADTGRRIANAQARDAGKAFQLARPAQLVRAAQPARPQPPENTTPPRRFPV